MLEIMNSRDNLAFTLAEVLITLGIIGVVAAITIPNLIATHRAKQLRTRFLESYSIVQQVFKQMEADDVSLDPKTYPPHTFYKTFKNYLTGALDCGQNANYTTAVVQSKACYYARFGGEEGGYKSFDGKKVVNNGILDNGQLALPNGTLIMFENPSYAQIIYVSVDLNGYNNPPNRFGYDLFTFQFLEGELKTMGAVGTAYANVNSYCNINTSNTYNGIACAQKAKEDPDYFKWAVKNLK